MRKLISKVGRKLFRNESGAALLEYSVLLGVILVAAVGTMIFAGEWVSAQWSALETALPATPAAPTPPAPPATP